MLCRRHASLSQVPKNQPSWAWPLALSAASTSWERLPILLMMGAMAELPRTKFTAAVDRVDDHPTHASTKFISRILDI
eukprot:SAG31_NODE_7608_length_1642_cov_2.813999_1_plen_77_part_10